MKQAFNEYCPTKANRSWLTLHLVLKKAMKVAGSNKYQIPHINKERLERQSQLLLQIDCEASIVTATMTILAAANN
jgi:hypothetical protein